MNDCSSCRSAAMVGAMVAGWVGFPTTKGGVHVGKLKERFLSKVVEDFSAVRAFRLDMDLDQGGRGNALRSITFRLRLSPPARHTVPMFFDPSTDIARIGGKDAPAYRVQSRTWRRAFTRFSKNLGMTGRMIADLWNVALNEALTEVSPDRRLLHTAMARAPIA